MEVLHPRCAGLDLSKRDAKVCVRIVPEGKVRAIETVTTWSSMTGEILALRDHLIAAEVTCVVMEATGDYWKPFYYLLEDAPFEVMLVNARDAKNLPGRKTDVSDAAWLAQLAAHGLLRASFVPPPPIRELRDLTRTRTVDHPGTDPRSATVGEGTGGRRDQAVGGGLRHHRRLRPDDAGRDGRRANVTRPCSRTCQCVALREKIPALTKALLPGRFTEHHAFLVELHCTMIDHHDAAIAALTRRIEEAMIPFRATRELICSIPGIGVTTADVIIAETGADMTVFPTPGRLASWAGVCPGHRESAGRAKSTKTRPGDRWLKGALGASAMSIASHSGTFLHVKYQRLARSRGRSKAIVAIEHTLLNVVWTMLTNGTYYDDPGPDYYTRRNPDRARNHALRQLNNLGYDVTLQPSGAA